MSFRDWFSGRRSVAMAVVGAALLGGLLGSWVTRATGPLFVGAGWDRTALASTATPVSPMPASFASVVQPALPGVVNIYSSRVVRRPGLPMPFFNDPFFQQFFGEEFGQLFSQPERVQSLGSGVIVRSDGIILTNNHVIEGASDVSVVLSDRRKFKATIVGTDPQTDVAVLRISATGLTALPLGDSSKAQVGDIVFAIGNPFGVGETVTMGIVSAKGRSDLALEGRNAYEDFIQTDAAINPGNSGGALINTRGEVIGINTAILTDSPMSRGNIGIGFAIPINMARHVMEQILEHGKVRRGYLGVLIQDVTPELAQQFGLSRPQGALVSQVEPDSPAARAGLERGDIILKFNGEEINSSADLRARVAQTSPSTTVRLDIFRNGQTRQVSVTLGELPGTLAAGGAGAGSALEGVQVQTLTPELAQRLGLSANTFGVVVTSVAPNSPAAAAGLQRGDVILEVNRHRVANAAQFQAMVEQAGNRPVLLLVNRGGQTFYLTIAPEQQ